MKIDIKHKTTSAVLFSATLDNNTVKKTLEIAVKEGANLSGASLYYANLAYANLSGAKLTGAKLSGANLTGARVCGSIINDSDKVILTLRWIVIVSSVTMRIGCKIYTHEKWRNFTDEQIAKMDENALTFWHENKETLLSACDAQNLTEGS